MNEPEPALPPYQWRRETARNGDAIHVLSVDGASHTIGSRYEPQKESDRFAAGLNLSDGDFVALVGGGARAANSLLSLGRRIRIAYLEPFPEIQTEGAGISNPRLKFFSSAAELLRHIRSMGVENVRRFRFVIHPALKSILREYGAWLSRRAQASLEERTSEVMTLAEVGSRVVDNLLANIGFLDRVFPAAHLTAPNPQPEISCVAGAGPSLDDSMDDIVAIREKLCLIAVDGAAAPLIDFGISPDVVVCLDPRPEEAEHIRAVDEASRRRLRWAVSAAVHPSVLKLLENCPVYLFRGDHPLEEWLAQRLGTPGELSSGGSVIIPAFDLATRMGSKEIILAGADFSYGRGFRSHSRGSSRVRQSVSRQSRFETIESQSFSDASEKAPRSVESGPDIRRTGENLLAYRRQLEARIREYRGICRQLRPGLALEGAEPLKTLSEFAQKPIYIYGEAVGHNKPLAAWAAPEDVISIKTEFSSRLKSENIGSDPLFRTAIESRIFQRVRRTGEEAQDVFAEESAGASAHLCRILENATEGP